ncbi:MAG: hypothetical protein ACQEQE_10830 [Bacillota bacterium]
MKKILSLALVLVLSFGMVSSSFANSFESKKNTEDGKVRYVKALAEDLDISYEKAYEINEAENEKYLSPVGIGTRSLTEEIRYEQITDNINISGANHDVQMASEVKFLYSNIDEEPIKILDLRGAFMAIPGASNLTIDGGTYNYDVSNYAARVSRLASISYEVQDSTGVSAGIGDIFSVNKTVTETYIITTNIMTFSQEIELSDIR